MGHNYASVNRKNRMKRAKKERERLERKRLRADDPKPTITTPPQAAAVAAPPPQVVAEPEKQETPKQETPKQEPGILEKVESWVGGLVSKVLGTEEK